jgi:hypothetical protein
LEILKPNSKKIRLLLVREKQGKNSTISGLYLVHVFPQPPKVEFLCWCLEDKVRAVKIAKETAIFTGIFPIRFRTEGRIHAAYKAKFPFHKGMLEICNLVNFKYVMFHIGNFIKDTEGCPLVGNDYILEGGEFKILNSTKTYEEVYPVIANYLLEGWEVEVEVKNSPNIIVG